MPAKQKLGKLTRTNPIAVAIAEGRPLIGLEGYLRIEHNYRTYFFKAKVTTADIKGEKVLCAGEIEGAYGCTSNEPMPFNSSNFYDEESMRRYLEDKAKEDEDEDDWDEDEDEDE